MSVSSLERCQSHWSDVSLTGVMSVSLERCQSHWSDVSLLTGATSVSMERCQSPHWSDVSVTGAMLVSSLERRQSHWSDVSLLTGVMSVSLEWCQSHWSDVSLLTGVMSVSLERCQSSWTLLLFSSLTRIRWRPSLGTWVSHRHGAKCGCQATLWSLDWSDSSGLYGPAEDFKSALAKEGRSGSSSPSVWLP